MIAVIGRPSQRHLRKISCSDHYTAGFVSHIHKHLSTFPCLSVFISYIIYVIRMINVTQVNFNRIGNINTHKSCIQILAKLFRVSSCTFSRSKTWHCNRNNIVMALSQLIHCGSRHKKRKSRIKAPGNSDDSCTASRMTKTLGQRR